MAMKNLIATKDQRYGTRMLKAGEPLTLAEPIAGVYRAIGAVRDPTDAEHKKHFEKAAVPAMTTQNTGQEAPKPAATPRKVRAKKGGKAKS
jgi:hypothetical protein